MPEGYSLDLTHKSAILFCLSQPELHLSTLVTYDKRAYHRRAGPVRSETTMDNRNSPGELQPPTSVSKLLVPS